MDIYDQYQASVLAVQEVRREDVSRYGIVKPMTGDDTAGKNYFRVEDLVEKPAVDEAPLILQ